MRAERELSPNGAPSGGTGVAVQRVHNERTEQNLKCLQDIAENSRNVFVEFVSEWIKANATDKEARRFEILGDERIEEVNRKSSSPLIKKSLTLKLQRNGERLLCETFYKNGSMKTRSLSKVPLEGIDQTQYKIPPSVQEYLDSQLK